MTSPFQIRQRSQQGHYLSRSVDTHHLKPLPLDRNCGHSYLGGEFASFDSVRTDLSANSKDVIIAGQWVVLGRIGQGSFGEVFEVEDIDTFRHYAIKREPTHIRNPQIQHESDMYDALAGGPGIPQCHWHGQHDGFECIIIDLLGPNLQQLKEVTRKFSVPIVVELSVQMVCILEHIHKRGLVYRDIKPDNFLFSSKHELPEPDMIEVPDEHGMPHIQYKTPSCEEIFAKWKEMHPKLYMVDFGLTTWWRHPVTNKPYPEAKKSIKNKTGTARYASLNVHRGKIHARRDDMESLGYLMLDLVFGTLPWSGIQARNSREGWDKMKQMKEETSMQDVCAGLPEGFLKFIEYTRKLKFTDEPDYNMLRDFLTGSLDNGPYSTCVKSPSGAPKWIQQHLGEKMTRPVNNNRQLIHHYEAASRQRRASYNPPRIHRRAATDDTDVFAMDDLMHNLPQQQESPRSSLASPKGNNNKRNDGDFSHSIRPKSYRGRKKRVGWNSHRHNDQSHSPFDWEADRIREAPS